MAMDVRLVMALLEGLKTVDGLKISMGPGDQITALLPDQRLFRISLQEITAEEFLASQTSAP